MPYNILLSYAHTQVVLAPFPPPVFLVKEIALHFRALNTVSAVNLNSINFRGFSSESVASILSSYHPTAALNLIPPPTGFFFFFFLKKKKIKNEKFDSLSNYLSLSYRIYHSYSLNSFTNPLCLQKGSCCFYC
jgi:hypothetical protein